MLNTQPIDCLFPRCGKRYGNFAPTTTASTWFVVAWLPFSVLFLATYLSSVAHYWVLLCNMNANRVEKNLRRQNKKMLDNDNGSKHSSRNEEVQCENLEMNDPVVLTNEKPPSLRQRIRENSNLSFGNENAAEAIASTMHDLIKIVHDKLERGEVFNSNESTNSLFFGSPPEEDALDDFDPGVNEETKPTRAISLFLRVLAEERVAHIIASEIAGRDFIAELKDDETLLVTIDKLKVVADKWKIPSLARTAFRQVVFEALFYVGERDLLKNGVSSFFDLSPVAFNSLMTPFLVGLGDAPTVEGWLASTDDIANDQHLPHNSKNTSNNIRFGSRCVVKDEIDDFFPANQGNAVLIKQRY